MPDSPSLRKNDSSLRLGVSPDGTGGVGSLGVDLQTKDVVLSPYALRQGDRVRVKGGSLVPAPGPKRIYAVAAGGHSRTFADVAKYATIPAASQLRLPYGGLGVHFSITAVRGVAAGQIIHGQNGADADPPLDVSLSTAGVLVAKMNWDGGGSETIQTAALTDGSTQHCWLFYDGAGTMYLYSNWTLVATNEVGISPNKRPVQTTSMTWLVGAKKAASGTVTLPFMGKIDALQVRTFRGVDFAQGSPSLRSTLLAHSLRQWPNPDEPSVVAQYDMDEASGSTMIDRSRFKNDGTYVGTPTVSDPVAWSHPTSNYVGEFQGADGSRTNMVGIGGAMYDEIVKTGA